MDANVVVTLFIHIINSFTLEVSIFNQSNAITFIDKLERHLIDNKVYQLFVFIFFCILFIYGCANMLYFESVNFFNCLLVNVHKGSVSIL